MASPALITSAPFAHSNDNTKSRACTWAQIIAAMRTISVGCERAAWLGRSKGWTAQQFVNRMLACGAVEGLI